MPMAADDIAAMIKAALPDAEVEITDLAGDGDHYAARVTSAAFAGKNRVQRQQRVHAALGELLETGELHALSFKTLTPEEWSTQRG